MKNKVRILVVDDEVQILKLLGVTLTSHGFEVAEATTGQEALGLVGSYKPDIVILDLGLPDMDGLEVINRLREWTKTPIIILSARQQENDKIIALDAGADDYLTKPFGTGELLARIRAALRHMAGVENEPVLKFDDLVIDLAHRRVTVKEKELKLSPTEYDLVKNLAICAGKVLTHKYLLRTVWGPSYENDVHYLRVYMGQLRRKLEADPSRPRHIITEPGIGYRLL
ncbi:MAG: Fis family transcriptional regulator [Peptococcaceae bacterium BICA1-7]|nr:MAG: Fis family transcriptional regulator [Peptococcaceae bacterium BICA1-7]HBV97836.1 DNA-binding response regulator [Desulfotomaculum sp.]